jgi:predicted porin
VKKRFSLASFRVVAALAGAAFGVTAATPAKADVVFYEKDNWSVYTRGLIATHYQYAFGDGDPAAAQGVLVGGKILPGAATDPINQKLKLSRIRSGFIGTQLGVGVRRIISDRVKVDSLIAINLADVSSNRNQEINKSVDVREAWAAVETPVGTFKFGRQFMIFGSGSAPVVMISHKYGVGNPCFVNFPTIACASVGAGALYAGFDAQLRYETPRFAGLQFQVAASDPWIGPGYQMTSTPRFDAELNLDLKFGDTGRVRAFAQGVTQTIKRRNVDLSLTTGTVMGGMGTAVLEVAGLAIGGGGWQCKGCGTRQVFEVGVDSANPLAYDNTTFDLRTARGFFGNAGYTFYDFTLAAGAGAAYVRPTVSDAAANTPVSVLKSSTEYHVTFTKKIDAIALIAEYMHWKNTWHFGEKQDVTYTGLGANFVW